MKKDMNIKAAIYTICTLCYTTMVATGCASGGNGTLLRAPVEIARPESASVPASTFIRYATLGLDEALGNSGLQPAFTQYWRAHAEHDWRLKYGLEYDLTHLTEDFYGQYYAKAWAIKSMTVNSLGRDGDFAIVEISLNFVDPNSSRETVTQEASDVWRSVGAEWLHVNLDPILKKKQSKPGNAKQ